MPDRHGCFARNVMRVQAALCALAWLLAQGKDIVPIPGARHRKYLEENVAAVGITLTREDLAH